MSLFLIGPSGVGKSTLKELLLKDFDNKFEESISCTSRKPRSGEVNGVDYYFISAKDFMKKIDENLFVEWEEVHGNYYGTLYSEIDRIKNSSKIPVFDIDLKGANNLLIRLNEPKEHVVFILPENFEVLRQRLISRETETQDEINLRLLRAKWEIDQSKNYPNKIINKDLQQTYQDLLKILKKQYVF